MTRKTKPENDTGISSQAAAPLPRRQTVSRARRDSASPATPVPPSTDVDAIVTSESSSSAAGPKPRRKPQSPRTSRKPAKAETSASLSTHQQTREWPVAAAAAEPSPEAIAELAYHYWQARGGRDGSPDEDWLRAERELRLRAKATA